jgi:hypothetical protein
MTLAEKPTRKGGLSRRRKNFLEGYWEGYWEGYRLMLRRLIGLKFGPLSPDALSHLDAVQDAALIRYTDRVLTATSVAEVLRA